MRYKPSSPFVVPMLLLVPTTSTVVGVLTKTWPKLSDAPLIYGSFRSFGGTETTANGVYSVEDTATIETWYRPDITAACRIVLANDTTAVYEVVGTPEDIEMRHQFMQIRVRRVKGGA